MNDKIFRDTCAMEAMHLFSMDRESVATLKEEGFNPKHNLVAKFCFDLAEAMLKERKKRESE